MRTSQALAAVSVALLAVVATPAEAQNREHLQMAAELRMLQEQNQQLSAALAQLTEALKAVSARLDATEEFQRRRFADQEILVKNLASDLGAIRERTQDTDTRLRSLSDEIDALRKTFLQLPALIAQAQPAPVDPNDPNAAAPPAPGDAPAPAPVQPTLTLPPTAGLSPTRVYETAFSDYTAGQYELAIRGFEQLIANFPTATLADDAQFFIGESYERLNRNAEAIDAYNRVIQAYADGDQVDMAYYRRGFVEAKVGQSEAARATWQAVVERFPESQGATLAKQRLAGLSRPSAPARP